MTDVVRVCELHHVYPGGGEVTLSGQDFVVGPGERVAILGPNGSGKTTLLLHMVGLLTATSCQHCTVLGLDPRRDFRQLIRRVGVVLQHVDEQIIGPTVWDDVAFGPKSHGLPPAEVRARAEEALDLVGIRELAGRIPHYLSGGERKKVAIAGALAMRPELLILDEPFDNLDPRSRADLIEILNRLNRERGMALVVTTHDVNLVPRIADVVYVFSRGRILARGAPLEVFRRPEVLSEANLEPPALVQLFAALERRGVPVSPPASVEDAAEQIWRLLGSSGQGERSGDPPPVFPRARVAGQGG